MGKGLLSGEQEENDELLGTEYTYVEIHPAVPSTFELLAMCSLNLNQVMTEIVSTF